MKRVLIALFLGCLFFLLFIGCGKRENPVRTTYSFAGPWKLGCSDLGYASLRGDKLHSPIKWVWIYLPPQYDLERHSPLLGTGFPVLYLLHDFGDDNETFYNIYKVQQIADRLIDNGEIQPMIIVMPDGSTPYPLWGSFYANSDLTGRYEDYIRELMDIIDVNLHTVVNEVEEKWVPDPRYRAISGHGMGGYGAFRLALDYDTTLFQSVSGMSPFLSFGSFLTDEIIEEVFIENEIAEGDFSDSSYKTINPWPDSLHPQKPRTQLIFAMAAAFSPHDITDTIPDDPYFFELIKIGEKRYGVDLPFDSTRYISPEPGTPWDRWMSNHDITTLFRGKGSEGGFGELKIYFDCRDFDQLNEGTQLFDDFLSWAGIEHTYVEYPGYGNYPAEHKNFIYDRLPEILKFHSRHFPPPTWE